MNRILAASALLLLASAPLLAQAPRRENLPKPSGPPVFQPLRPVTPPEPPPPSYVGDIPVGRSPASGPKEAPVTIVEISDFQ